MTQPEPFFVQSGPNGTEQTFQIAGRPWTVTMVLEPETRWVRELTIRPDGPCPPGGVSARLLREVPLSAAVRPRGKERAMTSYRPPTSPARRSWPPEAYAGLAARYLDLVANGSRSPNVDLAAELGPGYTADWAKEAIRRARQYGYLTRPTSPGQIGGELTDLAREALA